MGTCWYLYEKQLFLLVLHSTSHALLFGHLYSQDKLPSLELKSCSAIQFKHQHHTLHPLRDVADKEEQKPWRF